MLGTMVVRQKTGGMREDTLGLHTKTVDMVMVSRKKERASY